MVKCQTMNCNQPHQIVIVGGGFGGLYAAQSLRGSDVEVTLIDRRNFHLFQPLLYQVATGGLSPADIASPLRAVLSRQRNVRVLQGEVTGFEVENRQVLLGEERIRYDTLIVAAGSSHHYFGNDQWECLAPGLKTIEDALHTRQRVFQAFEQAEREGDPDIRKQLMTFVVVGGGPTGVELAGAIGELAQHTLRRDFRSIDTASASVLLLEGTDRLLPTYPPELSESASDSLKRLGVTVRKNTLVTDIRSDCVTVRSSDHIESVPCRTVLWAAGVKASSLGQTLAAVTAARLDRQGRLVVEPDLSLPNHPEILVLGDLAHFHHGVAEPLPGVAPVAMQQGRYAARLIKHRLQGHETRPFHYKDRGSMAVIGRSAAVAQIARFRFTGLFAWLTWLFVHLIYLVEYENRAIVLLQWGWNYVTRNRSARLITNVSSEAQVETREPEVAAL